jgi:hypothetical protein
LLQEGRWVLAEDLLPGDVVLLRSGELVTLDSVQLDEVEEWVYNFQVAELQNYAVGNCGILVHNANDPPKSGKQGTPQPTQEPQGSGKPAAQDAGEAAPKRSANRKPGHSDSRKRDNIVQRKLKAGKQNKLREKKQAKKKLEKAAEDAWQDMGEAAQQMHEKTIGKDKWIENWMKENRK